MTSSSRAPYRRHDLQRIIDPQSVVIVGASPKAESFGARTLDNLTGYQGRVHLVNARYETIGERRCYPSIAALPEVPDCAIVAVPREAVEAIVEECARVGVGGVVVFASGYAETGKAERIAQQTRLAKIARETGIRIVGPNCLGLVNYASGLIVSFAVYPRQATVRRPSIGLVSQSGALSQSLVQAVERGTSFSHVLTSGNSSDVDVADLVAWLAEEPACQSIACVFEGMPEPRRFLEAAQLAWANDKPLIVYKIATGEQGAAAAMSHTGSLAGSNAAYRAAFEQAGAILVDDFEALVETAAFFAKAPARPMAPGVAVMATSGGAAIMAADKAEIHGVPLPQPGDAARAMLEQHIPEFGSARNPCDVTAQVTSNLETLRACVEALVGDPAFGTLVVPHPVAYDVATPRIQAFSEIAHAHGKMACSVWVTEWLEGPGAHEAETNPHLALFQSMNHCFAALAAWQKRAARRQKERERLPAHEARSLPRAACAAATQAAALIGAACGPALTEREAKAVLALYEVPVVGERLTDSAEAAVAAADSLGYPVVLKVESPDLPHKTEAGVIRLGVRTADEVREAWRTVMASADRVTPTPRVNGVLVQPMVPGGVEVMVGARIDPLFGPLVVVGLGGIFVELLKDTSVGLAPVDGRAARAMLESLKGAALLKGFRGSQPVDLDVLGEVVARLSEFIADQASAITELDVNPLICAGSRIVAVDALIVKA